jgi:hypothetical protein
LFNLPKKEFYQKILRRKNHVHVTWSQKEAVNNVFSTAVQETFRAPNYATLGAAQAHAVERIKDFNGQSIRYKLSAACGANFASCKVEIHSGSRAALMDFFEDFYIEHMKNALSFTKVTKVYDATKPQQTRKSPLQSIQVPDVPDSKYCFFAAQVAVSLRDTAQGGAMSCENLINVDDFAHVKAYLLVGKATRSDLRRLSMTGAATGIFSIDDAAAKKCSALVKLFANLKHCAATVFGAVAGETSPADVSLAYCTLVCFDTVPYTHSHTVHTYSRMYTRTQNQIWSRVTQQIHTYTM